MADLSIAMLVITRLGTCSWLWPEIDLFPEAGAYYCISYIAAGHMRRDPHHVKQKAARKRGACAWSMDDRHATSKRHSDPNAFVRKMDNSQFQGF